MGEPGPVEALAGALWQIVPRQVFSEINPFIVSVPGI